MQRCRAATPGALNLPIAVVALPVMFAPPVVVAVLLAVVAVEVPFEDGIRRQPAKVLQYRRADRDHSRYSLVTSHAYLR